MQLIKKIVFILQKVFCEPEIERNTHCINCGIQLTGSQRRFCSEPCNNTYWRKKYSGTGVSKSTPVSKQERKKLKIKQKAKELAKKKYPKLGNCEVCNEKATYRYHLDYSKPLEVNMLCWSCLGKVCVNLISVERGFKEKEYE